MANKTVYKIVLIDWEKYNPDPKKFYRRANIDFNFLCNPKVRQLTPCGTLLYLSLLLVAAESQRSHIEVSHESIVFQSRVKSGSVQSQLAQLESLQLVKLGTKLALKKRRIEKKNRIEGPLEKLPTAKAAAPQIIPVYCFLWKERYGTNPPINGRAAGQLTRLVKDFGYERTSKILEAYLQMPDPWFVTKRHDVSTLLTNLNAVVQFLDTGKMVTKAHLNKINEQLDEKLGPKPKGIEEILKEKAARENKDLTV
jgi:hypothetical protein